MILLFFGRGRRREEEVGIKVYQLSGSDSNKWDAVYVPMKQ